MLKYEESRTEHIVARLVTIGRIMKVIVIVTTMLSVAGSFAAIGTILGGDGTIAALCGLLLGLLLGIYFATLIMVLIEWCAQVLVALENIAVSQKK